MKKKLGVLLSLGFILSMILLSGCATTRYGMQQSNGIAIGEDTAKLEKAGNINRAYTVSYKTLNQVGVITSIDTATGTIVAEVKSSKVIARIEPISSNLVRIKVTARKNFELMPDIETAVEIINLIYYRV
jgi:hypothetical protein